MLNGFGLYELLLSPNDDLSLVQSTHPSLRVTQKQQFFNQPMLALKRPSPRQRDPRRAKWEYPEINRGTSNTGRGTDRLRFL